MDRALLMISRENDNPGYHAYWSDRLKGDLRIEVIDSDHLGLRRAQQARLASRLVSTWLAENA